MSGGRLVLLDRLGRDARAFPLEEGLATIGSDPGCDIRLLLPTVSPHHATVVVHANQTVVSSMAAGELLVNGAPTGAAALRHGDRLAVGGRTLRWDYEDTLSPSARGVRGVRGVRARRSLQLPAPPAPPRASLPASSGKQVAVVQPQRRAAAAAAAAARGTTKSTEEGSPSGRRARSSAHHSAHSPRVPARRPSPGARPEDARAGPWLASRRRPRVTKIRAPARIDFTKRAALMLMAGLAPGARAPGGRSPGARAPRRHTAGGLARDSEPIFQSSMSCPKKSSLKNPSIKRNIKKPESIKFDLSNLEQPEVPAASDEELSLRYSDSPGSPGSPSPRRALPARAARRPPSPGPSRSRASARQTPLSSPARKSARGSLILERALGNSTFDFSRVSRSTVETPSDRSYRTTAESVRSSRAPGRRSEAYSVGELAASAYGSALGSGAARTPDNRSPLSLNGTRVSRAARSRSRLNDSDSLALTADEDASPRSSRRGRPAAASPGPGRTGTDCSGGGPATPEEGRGPEEATTPVLSIRNLLDRSSPGRGSRRPRRAARSLGCARPTKMPRLSIKSRSLLATSKRASRALRRPSSSAAAAVSRAEAEAEAVTPTTAIKPVQEGVKNKHSSAKKTQSKRSIIDNLDESDLVKQLFNSPVKRKLSQSMTEFSRKRLFEDEDDASARTTESMVELTITPDASILESTQMYTPDVFVSPLSGSDPSPNVAGLKRLFGKNTPENDLRNVQGVRALLRSPRTRRSVRNDLTDVSGLKRAFAGSPRNRLSDVRVKELFTSSPKNDLTRVSGVKLLFRSAKKQKSPKNSLEDLAGVEELFQNSTLNDSQNDSGAKATARLQSPKNDPSDVRSPRLACRGEAAAHSASDVDGGDDVSFRHSQNSDSTFDLLRGDLRVRSYSKSKSSTETFKPKRRRDARSLHDSIGLITDNVEEWLESELRKRFRRDANESLAKRSLAKSNLTRELQKLSTDTVEGGAPLLAGRSRNGALTRSGLSEGSLRKKSASEIYSAHTLPIKKRSLVEARPPHRLPIKKRVLVHSTPVKGRLSVAMNASDLGRVSPIAPEGKAGHPNPITTEGSPKTKKGKSSPMECENSKPVKVLPETGGTRSSDNRPDRDQPSVRYSTRNTKVNVTGNARRRRLSRVVKKKPVPSPKPNTEALNSISEDINNKIESERLNQINRTKSQVAETFITLRKTRAKVRKTDATVSDSAKQIQGVLQSKTVKTPKNTRSKSKEVCRRLSKKLKPQTVQRDVNESNDDRGPRTDERLTRLPTPNNAENVNNTHETRRTRNGNKKTTNVNTVVKKQPQKKKKTVVNSNFSKKNIPKSPKEDGQIVPPVENIPKVTAAKKVNWKANPAQTEKKEVQSTRRNRNKEIAIPVIEPSKEVAAVPTNRRRLRKDVVDHLIITNDKSLENMTGRARRGAKSKEIIKNVDVSVSNGIEKNINANGNKRKTRSKNVVQVTSQEDVKRVRTRGRGYKEKVAENADVKISDTMRDAKVKNTTKKIAETNIDTEPIVRKRTRQRRKEPDIENTKKITENNTNTETDTEPIVGKRTRQRRKEPDIENTKNITENNTNTETDTEPIVGKRTRQRRKEPDTENTQRGRKKEAKEESVPDQSVNLKVGRRTRNARGVNYSEQARARPRATRDSQQVESTEHDDNEKAETIQAAPVAPPRKVTRARNKDTDAESSPPQEPPGEAAAGSTRRGARAAAKRGGDAAPAGEEPAKRQRTTRAAAAARAGGPSRR